MLAWRRQHRQSGAQRVRGCSNLQPQAAGAANAAAAVCGRRASAAAWAVPSPAQHRSAFRRQAPPSGRRRGSRARQAERGVRGVTGACTAHSAGCRPAYRRRPRRPPFRRVESVGMGVTSSAAGGGRGWRHMVSRQSSERTGCPMCGSKQGPVEPCKPPSCVSLQRMDLQLRQPANCASLARTNAADLDAGAGQGAQRGLGAGAGGLGAVAAGGAQLDVQRVHAQLLQRVERGGRHSGSVRRNGRAQREAAPQRRDAGCGAAVRVAVPVQQQPGMSAAAQRQCLQQHRLHQHQHQQPHTATPPTLQRVATSCAASMAA